MLGIGSNVLLQNLFFKNGGFVKDICQAHFARAGHISAQVTSQLERSHEGS